MAIPTTAWDETNPPDTRVSSPETLRAEGDDRIRELKTQFREVFAVDHKMPYAYPGTLNGTDWGYHNKLTLNKSTALISETGIGNLYCYAPASVYNLGYHNGTVATWFMYDDEIVGGFSGEIRAWYGTLATIPSGWVVCNGTSGTPDLQSKFVRGLFTSATEQGIPPGSRQGSNYVYLDDPKYLPTHTHTATISNVANHAHTAYTYRSLVPYGFVTSITGGGIYWAPNTISGGKTTISGGEHLHSITNSSTGFGFQIDNRPVYYEVFFIMKT